MRIAWLSKFQHKLNEVTMTAGRFSEWKKWHVQSRNLPPQSMIFLQFISSYLRTAWTMGYFYLLRAQISLRFRLLPLSGLSLVSALCSR